MSVFASIPYGQSDPAGYFSDVIDKSISTNDHRIIILAQSIHNFLQGLLRTVKVIRIKLDGITTTVRRINGFIPAAANAQITPLRNNLMNMGILLNELFNDIRGAIRRMIIHNNNIKAKLVFCPNALSIASLMVFLRLSTGMTTLTFH